jgi:hypothetical protein
MSSGRPERLIGLPVTYQWKEHAEAGGLVSYGASLTGVWRQTALVVGKILKGAKPADLPIDTRYWITWSARWSSVCGIVSPSALAVFKLMTSSILVGCSLDQRGQLLRRVKAVFVFALFVGACALANTPQQDLALCAVGKVQFDRDVARDRSTWSNSCVLRSASPGSLLTAQKAAAFVQSLVGRQSERLVLFREHAVENLRRFGRAHILGHVDLLCGIESDLPGL